MNLTVEQIEKDIRGFQARITEARQKLASLPSGYLPYAEHKKRENIRRDCEADIKHCETLISYGLEGIKIREGEAASL